MSNERPYLDHLKKYDDLITSYEETRAAFVAQALEKTRLAVPYIEQARDIKLTASRVSKPMDLLSVEKLQGALAAAAGISDKGDAHVPAEAKKEAIIGLINTYLEPAGENFVEEFVFRFLLTRGDSLGGSMRNLIGSLAKRKMTRAVLANLKNSGIEKSYWLPSGGGKWNPVPDNDADIESLLCALSWKGDRTIVFNKTPKFIGNNIDICLLNCDYSDYKVALEDPKKFIALGELKGGIDPAGADEHWKTANSALERIRTTFEGHKLTPHTFFVGAAIEENMAKEIWAQLEAGRLSNAANLTDSDQFISLCNWLGSL